MARFQKSVPYLKPRNNRPRWEPGPALRAAGFGGKDLKDAQGRWLSEPEAIAAAETLNAEVTAWRNVGAPRRRPQIPLRPATCCATLWDTYKRSPRWQRLATSTRRDYESKANVWLGTFADMDAAAVRHHHLYAWWEQIHAERGHAMANGILAVVRLALSHAVRLGWITTNPARSLGLIGVAPRCVVWSPSEVEALLAAADELDMPSVGDAVVIALHTGQRQGDVLRLDTPQISAGRATFRQAKTGARVRVPITSQLEERLEAIRRRRRFPGPVVPFMSSRIVLDAERRPYTASGFGKAWRAVREQAAAALPTCSDKMFLDLRDTAVTRLALAGCTVPEIRAITGHSMQTVHGVLQHYLALDDRMAESAIERLRVWMNEEGIAV